MTSITKSNLLRRHMLFAVIALAGTLGLFGFWSLDALQRSTQEIIGERLVIAETMAFHVDEHLGEVVSHLEETAQHLPRGGDIPPSSLRSALRNAIVGFRSRTLGMLLLDRTGAVVVAEPAGWEQDGLNFKKYTFVNDSLVKGKAGISGAMNLPGIEKISVLISFPIKDSNGLIEGALLVALDPASPGVLGAVGATKLGNTGYAQVIDDSGLLMVSTRPDNMAREIDHSPRFIELIKSGQKTVATCHRCHESGQRQVDVIAFAPVQTAPWGIVIRQSEEEAFELVNDLRLKILLASIVSVLVLGILALTILRNVITPIRQLTAAARRITSGDFGGSIPRVGLDEIGILAQSLEAMRSSLNASREEMARRNQELQAKTDELQQKEEQRRQLLDKVIQAQEEERKRIARELHDEIGQTLTALAMSLDAIQQTLPDDSTELRAKLEGFRTLAANTIKETRRLMLDLRPTLLDDLGLVPAIEWYAETYLGRAGVDLHINVDGLRRRLPSQTETVLFRIIQEAITNTIKHARAREMHISLEAQDSTVKALIKDDGQGFDVRRSGRDGKKGLGILGMEERVSLLGGTFHLLSEPGKGTAITLSIPFAEGAK